MLHVRDHIGHVLREVRLSQGKTLRRVANDAAIALGYLSEVERGVKEASSEVVETVAGALGVPLSYVYQQVAELILLEEIANTPVDVAPPSPAELQRQRDLEARHLRVPN